MTPEELQKLANASAEHNDYTKESKGGDFERSLPVAGACVIRLREYIELGLQKTASKTYPNKKPAVKARFTFELTQPKHKMEFEDSENNVTYRYIYVENLEIEIGEGLKTLDIMITKVEEA